MQNLRPEAALPYLVPASEKFEDYTQDSFFGTGTRMAVLAAGTEYGVAKAANIYVIKAMWSYRDPVRDSEVRGKLWESAGRRTLQRAYEIVLQKVREQSLYGKAVVVIGRRKSKRPIPLPLLQSQTNINGARITDPQSSRGEPHG